MGEGSIGPKLEKNDPELPSGEIPKSIKSQVSLNPKPGRCLHIGKLIVAALLDPGKAWQLFHTRMGQVKGGNILVCIVGVCIIAYVAWQWLHPFISTSYSANNNTNSEIIQGSPNAVIDKSVHNYELPALALTWTKHTKISGNLALPFEVDLEITPNVEWHPVSFIIACDHEIKEVDVLGGMFDRLDSSVTAQSNKIGYVYYVDPPLAAGASQHVSVLSDQQFDVIDVQAAKVIPRRNVADPSQP